jgi:hypothetical protein
LKMIANILEELKLNFLPHCKCVMKSSMQYQRNNVMTFTHVLPFLLYIL